MIDLGTIRPGQTIRIPFSSFDKDDGSSITMTGYAVADLLIYKDGGTTERASTSGFTATTDFDAKTGKHLAVIDLADDTTADFFKAGSEYLVAIDAVTVDAVTTGGWIARFRIGYPDAILDTHIATLTDQTNFTLNEGPAENDALNSRLLILHDKASKVQVAHGIVEDYVGSTKAVVLAAAPTFTIAAGDNVSAFGLAPLQPTTTGRKLTIESDGMAHADLKEWLGVAMSALISGRVDSNAQVVGDKTGYRLSATGVDDILDEALSGHTTAGTAGEALNAILSATIGLAILEGLVDDLEARLTAGRAANLDNLDVVLSTRAIPGDAMSLSDGAITAPKIAAAALTAAKFAAGAVDANALAADAATEIAAAVKALVVESEGSYTLGQVLSIVLAVLAGVTSSGGATLKTPNGVASRVAATLNASQERTAMTLTPST